MIKTESNQKLTPPYSQLQTCFKAMQAVEKHKLPEQQVAQGIQLIIQTVQRDHMIQPIELRVLTQCIKCLATFCSYGWPMREVCLRFGVLQHCIGVLETFLASQPDGDSTEDEITSKIYFNVRAILRLACNMVTEAPEVSDVDCDIQSDCLEVVASSEKLMSCVRQRSSDETVAVPFLVFLFNALAKRPDLRERIVGAEGASCSGVLALREVFCAQSSEKESSDSEEGNNVLQEWMTRLFVLLMTNLNGDFDVLEHDIDETHPSLFLPLAEKFGPEATSMLLFFYAQIVKQHLENMKAAKDETDEEEKELVCRDILPRHLLRDTVAYGYRRHEIFQASFTSDESLSQAYGCGEESKQRGSLEDELSLIVYLVQCWAQVAAFGPDWFKLTLIELGALEFTLDVLHTLKVIVDSLDRLGIFEQWKLRRDEPKQQTTYEVEEDSSQAAAAQTQSQTELQKHPFGGYLSKLVSLVCSLTYRRHQRVEDFFMSEEGKLRLGAILSHTKMDVDNPMLREWSLVCIRNLCSWSDLIREDLKKLQLIEVNDEGKKSLEQLGVKELFEKELAKLKKKNSDGKSVFEQHNIHFDEVDF